jgi:hypothetical protein
MRILQLTALTVTVAFISCPAWAGEREARERAARKACLTGDYAKGVELLADLFLDSGNITYIFNQGRCLEQNHRYEDAIARFREYLVKGVSLSAEERADADKHIAVCQSYTPHAEPEKAASATVLENGVPGAASAPLATSEVASRAVPTEQAGRKLRIGGVVVASVGAAAVVTGVILNLKVNSMTNDLEQRYAYNRSTDSTRENYKTLGWIAYGVGGAAVATGAVLYMLGWSQGKAARVDNTVWLTPSLAPGAAGMTMAGTF